MLFDSKRIVVTERKQFFNALTGSTLKIRFFEKSILWNEKHRLERTAHRSVVLPVGFEEDTN